MCVGVGVEGAAPALTLDRVIVWVGSGCRSSAVFVCTWHHPTHCVRVEGVGGVRGGGEQGVEAVWMVALVAGGFLGDTE